MKTTKLKPEFEAKLRELKILTKWKKGVKTQCKNTGILFESRIEHFNTFLDFDHLIRVSFPWDETFEGVRFWYEISNK